MFKSWIVAKIEACIKELVIEYMEAWLKEQAQTNATTPATEELPK